MGLFDGARGDSDAGSTADVARLLRGRVLLVVDARSQGRSAAALVLGFTRFAPDLEFAGVILNRVGSSRHAQILRAALSSVPGLPPVVGCLPKTEELALPERHLGLVTADELVKDGSFFPRLADWTERHLDLDFLMRGGESTSEDRENTVKSKDLTPGVRTPRVRIAVARDEAFCFYYPENLELLQAAGAEIVFFSPLRDAALPPGIRGIYLGGGYPELHAGRLAANESLRRQMAAAAGEGVPIYAECGGFMYLAREIDGLPMCGAFPAAARMLPRRKALGYREVTLTSDGPFGAAGTVLRGHEFHDSQMDLPGAVARDYRLHRPDGEDLGVEGYRIGNVLGSYVHLHFGSNPKAAGRFVDFCRREQRRSPGGGEEPHRNPEPGSNLITSEPIT